MMTQPQIEEFAPENLHTQVDWVMCIVLPLVLASVIGNTDSRPALSTVRSRVVEQASLDRFQDASRQVVNAARSVEAAKKQLREARRVARDAHDEYERHREQAEIERRAKQTDREITTYERQLARRRGAVLATLFLFTFMNGVARRSLSSAAPSMVADGLSSVPQIEAIFMTGFEAFAVGKFLVVPTLLLLGVRRALLLQVSAMGACCAAYLIAPASHAVQAWGWIIFRIFSAMAVSTMLPFVGNWIPRRYYGRAFGLLFSGFQAGYIGISYYWGHLLQIGKLHWRVPFEHCTAGFALLLAASALCLHESPPARPGKMRGGSLSPALVTSSDGGGEQPPPQRRVQLGALMHKVTTRWVCWAMIIACATYSPAVEYSTHVTSYLKEMLWGNRHAPPTNGFVCLQSSICEGRYRSYVFSYVSALLVGSIAYDRASQLDRTVLVLTLYAMNVLCWVFLTLAEADAPAAAWVKAVVAPQSSLASWVGGGAKAVAAAKVDPILPLSGPMKTTLASIAGATIALPVSLPFAIFSLDFGKEGAAVLSGLLQVVSAASALIFLKLFPSILKKRGG